MKTVLYPASFDPVTLGHVDIAERAAMLFGKVIVGVFEKPLKNLLFSPQERLEMTQKAMAHIPNVTVLGYNGLTAHYAEAIGVAGIVRGLRAVSDFAGEMRRALGTRSIAKRVGNI